MREYLDLLSRVRREGRYKENRTGVGTYSISGVFVEFDLAGLQMPLVTTKRVPFRWVAEELLWFLRGETNVRSLQAKGVDIWDEWADKDGELGPVYGKQWRKWTAVDATEDTWDEPLPLPVAYIHHIDQIKQAVELLRKDEDSRRIIVSAWNPADIKKMKLPPCHMIFQFICTGNELTCCLFIRSWDLFLGAPFNIASYALLTHLVASVTGKRAAKLSIMAGDAHIYKNHLEAVDQQLTRPPLDTPVLLLQPQKELEHYTFEHMSVPAYKHHPSIKAEVAI